MTMRYDVSNGVQQQHFCSRSTLWRGSNGCDAFAGALEYLRSPANAPYGASSLLGSLVIPLPRSTSIPKKTARFTHARTQARNTLLPSRSFIPEETKTLHGGRDVSSIVHDGTPPPFLPFMI